MRAKLYSMLLAAIIAVSLGHVPQAQASSGEVDSAIEAAERQRITLMQRDFLGRLTRSTRQVGDPNQAVPNSQVSGLIQGLNGVTSLAKSPLNLAGNFGSTLTQGLSKLVGQFGPGGLTAPMGMASAENSTPHAVSPQTAENAQPRPGRILANPIVAATPIAAAGGGGQCPQGGLLSTCNSTDFDPAPQDSPSSNPRGQIQEFKCSGGGQGGSGYLCN
jgi:hypothetical protein